MKRKPLLCLAAAFLVTMTAAQGADAGTPAKIRDEWSAINDQIDRLEAELDAAEKTAAAERASQAAAQAEIDRVTAETAGIESQVAATDLEIKSLRNQVRMRAVSAYIGGGGGTSAYDFGSASEQSARSVYAAALSMTDAELINQLDAKVDEVKAQQRRLSGRRAQLQALVAGHAASAEKAEQAVAAAKAKKAELSKKADALAAKFSRNTGPIGNGSVCPAAGLQVQCSIVGQVERMISAARADGVNLTGGAYRNPAQQIALRAANCGGHDNFSVYGKPASACSPATARPGSSMHERGLAIDFDNCSSRSSACHRWMAANGSSYGFFNLPGEAWHWSTTGT